MRTASDHLKQNPSCRPSTLRFIEARNVTTAKLQEENRMDDILRKQIERSPRQWWHPRWPSWVWRW